MLEFEFGEIPDLPVPGKAIIYILELLRSGHGKWEGDFHLFDGEAEKIIYQVELVKPGYWKEELKPGSDFDNYFHYFLFNIERQPLITRFVNNKGRLLIISY